MTSTAAPPLISEQYRSHIKRISGRSRVLRLDCSEHTSKKAKPPYCGRYAIIPRPPDKSCVRHTINVRLRTREDRILPDIHLLSRVDFIINLGKCQSLILRIVIMAEKILRCLRFRRVKGGESAIQSISSRALTIRKCHTRSCPARRRGVRSLRATFTKHEQHEAALTSRPTQIGPESTHALSADKKETRGKRNKFFSLYRASNYFFI